MQALSQSAALDIRRRQPQCHTQFFLGVDDQLSAIELAAQTGDVAVQMLDLPSRGVRFRPSSFWRERRPIGRVDLLAPARNHRGVDALATQERAELIIDAQKKLCVALGLPTSDDRTEEE